MSGTNLRVIQHRAAAYVATFVLLLAAYVPVKAANWSVSGQVHTLIEVVATVLSLCVGALALVRFYSHKESTFLFIGTGFFVTGLLDGYHALVTVEGVLPPPGPAAEWSWFAGRLFLSLQLWLSWLACRRERRLGEQGRVSERLLYTGVVVGALGLFTLLAHVLTFHAYPDKLFVSRPLELVPALFFALALMGYLGKGRWRSDPFEHWLILTLITGLVGQALFMAGSTHANDAMSAAAHGLKIVSYGCAFIGILADMRHLYSDSLARHELTLKNLILTTQQETSQDAILVVDENDNIISYNRRFIELWGLSEEMVRRRDDRPVLAFVSEQVADREGFLRRVRYLYGHRSEEGFEEIALKDGRIIDRYSAPMTGPDGKYYGRVWYLRDITDKKRAEQNLRESEEKFRGLVDQSLVGIALIEGGRFSYVNHKFAGIFGYQPHEMTRLSPVDLASDRDKAVVAEALRRQLHPDGEGDEFTFQGLRKTGAIIEVEGRGARMHVGGELVLMIIMLDITARVRAEREIQRLQSRLRQQAIRDPLTRLYNRRYLAEALQDELARAGRGRYPVSVVMGDIDHFKVINDTYGHLAGDRVLRAFSALIKRHSRSSDIGCRYGGEEFLMVLPGMSKVTARDRTEQLRLAFAGVATHSDEATLRATASFGVATYPEDGREMEGLIAAADAALYAAKRAGRNHVSAARSKDQEPLPD